VSTKKVNMRSISVTAFAPASVGNVCVGFDILGMALEGVGDQVTLTLRKDSSEIRISDVTGVIVSLPKDARQNTAGAALLAMQDDLKFNFGFDVAIHKGIPFGSGMGGSAASAVAAAVAASAIYQRVTKKKLSLEKLFTYALEGERIAAGAAHPDNVAPCLYGGLTLSSPLFSQPGLQGEPAHKLNLLPLVPGAPSNFERLQALFPDFAELKKISSAFGVSDDEIRRVIRSGKKDWGEIWCPHTATAVAARESLKSPHWVMIATASPAKFSEIVAPLAGVTPEVPPALAELFARPSRSVLVDATVEAIAGELQKLK